jgi:hypothetical protein
MWLVYKPDEESEPQELWLDLDDIPDRETEMLEARSGFDWEEFKLKVLKANTKARRALLWYMLRREHHTLRYEDVKFTPKTFTVEFDAQELGQQVAELEKIESPSEIQSMALEAFRFQIASGEARPAGRGKASAESGV